MATRAVPPIWVVSVANWWSAAKPQNRTIWALLFGVDTSALDPGSSPGVIGIAVPPAGSADCSMNTPRPPHKVTRSGALTWSGGRPQAARAPEHGGQFVLG